MERIIVTDWEKVEKDDFYLSKAWKEGDIKQARKLQKEGGLYVAYEVPALSYALYKQMDAQQVFIDKDGNVVVTCESGVIDNKHTESWAIEE